MPSVVEKKQRDVAIWDLPTRLFHWSLVLLVGCDLFLISPRGGLHTLVHFLAGFAVASLVLFRIVWGFIGSPRSRFFDFLLPWRAVRAYAARLARLDPPHSIGHNPLGGWMIGLLLATLAAVILTGVFAESQRAAGPFAHLLRADLAHRLGNIHRLVSNLLIGLIAIHVAGVIADWLLTGENLVRSMITGRKRLTIEQAAEEGRLAPFSRAVIVGSLALALMVGLILITNFGTP